MKHYSRQTRTLTAIDCIIFGFDGKEIKILLIKRGFEPEKGKWSLMGGFVQPEETLEEAASRILKLLTGLGGVYMEQVHTFGDPHRDPVERTFSIAFFALVDIHKYEKQISEDSHAEWFPGKKIPRLIFDHNQMVQMAREKLQYKAAFHPILFELLPEKFTLPQLHSLYEDIFDATLDKRNFSRKIHSAKLLIKLKEKEKEKSKKGAYYFKIDKKKYKSIFYSVFNFIPNPDNLK
jgi:8-oxo-dGTP diphosphatase